MVLVITININPKKVELIKKAAEVHQAGHMTILEMASKREEKTVQDHLEHHPEEMNHPAGMLPEMNSPVGMLLEKKQLDMLPGTNLAGMHPEMNHCVVLVVMILLDIVMTVVGTVPMIIHPDIHGETNAT